ncbi:hypothetical protein NBRC10513_000699 [Rhodotorula toruloides]
MDREEGTRSIGCFSREAQSVRQRGRISAESSSPLLFFDTSTRTARIASPLVQSSSAHSPHPPHETSQLAMTRSSHHHKEVPHNLRSNYMPLKKEGSGRANWGSDHDDIVEGIALARSDDWISHSPADVGAHKLSISPPTSPSLADTAARTEDPAPSASA